MERFRPHGDVSDGIWNFFSPGRAVVLILVLASVSFGVSHLRSRPSVPQVEQQQLRERVLKVVVEPPQPSPSIPEASRDDEQEEIERAREQLLEKARHILEVRDQERRQGVPASFFEDFIDLPPRHNRQNRRIRKLLPSPNAVPVFYVA